MESGRSSRSRYVVFILGPLFFYQNHMNALEAFAASAWYLTLMGRPRRNCSEPHKHIAALIRRGYPFVYCDYSPYLPRSPGEGDVISRLWQGRHSSGMMLLIRLASTLGLRHKSMDGREQVSLSPALSSRPKCHIGSEACGGRSDSLFITSRLSVMASRPMSLITRVLCL